jgi:Fe-S-cluster formation regulator IscX/YfhJ
MALKPERQCVFHGEWNRMWYAHTVRKKYPHVQLTKSYPRMDGHAVELCRTARYMVDLTKFDNDGGGTQYSFLEAMDGGAVPVMSAAWVSYPGAAMRFGPAVRTARDLAALLAKPVDEEKLAKQRERNEHYLRTVHDPKTICEQYLHTLQP